MAPLDGSGFALVGPGMGPGLPCSRNPQKAKAGPGGSGWSGSVALSFVAAGPRITHDTRITRDARVRGYRECRGKTRTYPDHPDPWRFSAGFARARPGPNPDPHLDPPGPGTLGARAPPCCCDRRLLSIRIRRTPIVKNDTITTYLHGEIIEAQKPEWIGRAKTVCNGGEIPWHAALTKVLNFLPRIDSIGADDRDGIQILTWVTPEGGGHYVEFCTPHHIFEAVWVPEKAEWLPFRTKHILPFLRAHAAIATARSLERLAQHFCSAPAHQSSDQVTRRPDHPPLPASLLRAARAAHGA